MKRLALVSGLCAAAFALAPIAPASAEAESGRCTIEGSATFMKEALRAVPANLSYEFEGAAKCETLPGKEIRKGTVVVKGEETLSCAGSLGEAEGQGTLTLGGIKLPFGLTFFGGTPGATGLIVKFSGGGTAVGTATFLGSTIEPATACFVPSGASRLEFTAVAVGEL